MPRTPYVPRVPGPVYMPELPQLNGYPRPRIWNVLGGPIRALINTLMGKTVPLEEQPPYKNTFTRGYLPPFVSAKEMNPFRLHAPPIPLLPEETVVRQDAGNAGVQRIPDQGLQQYWNQKKEIPVPPALAPAHGVGVPTVYSSSATDMVPGYGHAYCYGWSQRHVPSTGRREHLLTAMPGIPLKKEKTKLTDASQSSSTRAPILGKAPKVR